MSHDTGSQHPRTSPIRWWIKDRGVLTDLLTGAAPEPPCYKGDETDTAIHLTTFSKTHRLHRTVWLQTLSIGLKEYIVEETCNEGSRLSQQQRLSLGKWTAISKLTVFNSESITDMRLRRSSAFKYNVELLL